MCVSTAKSKPPLDESFSELQALIRIDACPSQPVSRNVILELCEGPDAPLSTAAASQGYVFLKDADLWPLQGSAILQDRHFYKLLSLARTGVVVYWHASTGYLATSAETNIAGSIDSPTVLSRTLHILHVAHLHGATVSFDQPLGASSWEEPETVRAMNSFLAFEAVIAPCHWDPTGTEQPTPVRRFRSNSIRIRSAHRPCSCPCEHISPGGGLHVFTTTCPQVIATHVVQALLPPLPDKAGPLSVDSLWTSLPPHPPHRGSYIPDGGGLHSSAEWPLPFCADVFKPLRDRLLGLFLSKDIVHALTTALKSEPPYDPFTRELSTLSPHVLDAFHTFIQSQGLDPDISIPVGQPFRLQAFQSLASVAEDNDVALFDLLKSGVRLGTDGPLPPSGSWPLKTDATKDLESARMAASDFTLADCNWSSAEQSPELVGQLIQTEIEDGYVTHIPGGLQEIKARWGTRVAVGRLAVATHPTRNPRLVLDSSVCGVNTAAAASIPEKTFNPSLADLRSAHTLGHAQQTTLLSIDIKAAHKRIRVHEQDQGYLAFSYRTAGREYWYTYNVTHFGGTFSAWYWSRLGGALLRLLHRVLYCRHTAVLYVDDFLFLFDSPTALLQSAIVLATLHYLSVPISWSKLQFSSSVSWIGWQIDSFQDLVSVPPAKVKRIVDLLVHVTSSKRVSRKALEQLAGNLLWLSEHVHVLRWYLGPLYTLLRKQGVQLVHLQQPTLRNLLGSLTDSFTTSVPLNAPFIPQGSKLQRVGTVQAADCASLTTLTAHCGHLQHAWCSFINTRSNFVKLLPDDVSLLQAMHSVILMSDMSISLSLIPRFQIKAAADACADEASFGLGAWIEFPSGLTSWCAYQGTPKDLPSWLADHPPQRLIASLELAAQVLTLMLLIQIAHHPSQFEIVSGLDNQSAEGILCHGFTTCIPATRVLQILNVLLQFSQSRLTPYRLSSQDNWRADHLSRGHFSHESPQTRSALPLSNLWDAFGLLE